jgi:choline dehydrogenase-like flavoprotein
MQKTFAEIVAAMGGRVQGEVVKDGAKAISRGGQIIHELGGTIMGDKPNESVTNSFGRAWDVKNLFVMDGATFVSNADKNPTLTIMALAWRSADHVLDLMRRKEL